MALKEVDVIPLNAPASTTTKVVTAAPMFTGGSMVTAPPEIDTDEDDTPMVENAVPPALFALNVILPVPFVTCWLKVITILDARATSVTPIPGLKVMGIGGTSSLVAVIIPARTFLLSSITVVSEILIAIFVYTRRLLLFSFF